MLSEQTANAQPDAATCCRWHRNLHFCYGLHQKHVCTSCICDYDADATCKACRSPQTWQRPDEFDVDRWRPGGPVPSELTENFAYLPFGGGRRKCIGNSLPLRAQQHCSLLDVCDAGWHE